MKQNIGKADQTIRILLGALIAIAGFYFKSWWGLVAIIPFVTAFTGLCPLYKILGINSKKANEVPQPTNNQ